MLLLHHIHQGSVTLSWLLLLSCHHGCIALVHPSLPLLGGLLDCPLLLLGVLKWSHHPLLLHLGAELALRQVTLLWGMLHVPTTNHDH